jgi:hypothetical protein
MPKWKKGAKEFTVGINYHDRRGYQSSIPKPVIDALGNPDEIKFIIDGKKIEVTTPKDKKPRPGVQ